MTSSSFGHSSLLAAVCFRDTSHALFARYVRFRARAANVGIRTALLDGVATLR